MTVVIRGSVYYLATAVVGGSVFISSLVQLTLGHVSCNTLTHWSRLLQPVEREREARDMFTLVGLYSNEKSM